MYIQNALLHALRHCKIINTGEASLLFRLYINGKIATEDWESMGASDRVAVPDCPRYADIAFKVKNDSDEELTFAALITGQECET